MSSKNFIPLPEIGEHTDKINIQSLGLPVGFDQERLGVNVRAFEGAMRHASIGRLGIRAIEGESRQIEAGVGGVNTDGTASLLGKVVAKKVDLSDSSSRWVVPRVGEGYIDLTGGLKDHYGKLEALVTINSSEKEARIEEKPRKWKKGVMEPKAQAHFIDDAVRSELRKLIHESHFTAGKKISTGIDASAYSVMPILYSQVFSDLGTAEAAITGGMAALAFTQGWHLGNHIFTARDHGLHWSDRNWSLFHGIPFERNLFAKIHANRTFVKAIG